MTLLEKYIISLSNLYGVVHKNKVLEIYKDQNDDQITLDDVDALVKKPSQELSDGFVRSHKDHFVHDAVFNDIEFQELLIKQRNKPHYIPNKNQLLKYEDDEYFEKTKEYKSLYIYIKKNFLKQEPEKVEWLCEEILINSQLGGGVKSNLEIFEMFDISFNDMEQVNKVAVLITDFSNNVRLWENSGHTPKELFVLSQQSYLENLSDSKDLSKEAGSFEGVGRNDKCPCGSGKKFKMCCLKKYS